MPTAVKTTENQAKHLTKAEIAARETAEAQFLPDRMPAKVPRSLKSDKEAAKTWKETLDRMAGLGLIDILDTDTLAIYCSMTSRRLDMLADLAALKDMDPEPALVKTRIDLQKQILSTETAILSYASKLGLTPESRARLAKRAAEQEPAGEDDDLFA